MNEIEKMIANDLEYIIKDFERALTDFANCEKTLNGYIPYREQRRIFMNFANVLGTLKNIENEVKNDN